MAGRPRTFDESEVLDRAVDLFWRKGYAATSVGDLISHMGINRQSLYNTFGDKRQLFLKALERYRDRRSDELLGLLEGEDASLGAIRDFFGVIESFLCVKDPSACMMGKCSLEVGMADAEVGAHLKAHMEGMEKAFEGAIRRAIEKGEVKEVDEPHALACMLTTTTHGLGVLARAGAEPEQVRATIRMALSLLR